MADADESVHLAAALVAEQRRGLAVSDRQVAVALEPVVVDRILEGTGHRTQRKDFVVLALVADDEHAVLVVVPVPGHLVEVGLRHVRRAGADVAAPVLFVLDKADEGAEDALALGHEQRQALPYALVGHEDAQLSAQLVVVALFRLFDGGEILGQFALFVKAGAVDAREHLVVLVAAPIRAGQRRQLERLDHARRRQMRTCAQVDEIALTIEGDLGVLGQIVDQLDLVGLVVALHQLDRLFARQHESLELVVRLDDLRHLALDHLQLFERDGRRKVEIVIKSLVDRRSDRKFDRRMHALHRLRENVRAGVTIDAPALGVFECQDLQRAVLFGHIAQLDDIAVDDRAERRTRQPFRNARRDLRYALTFRALERASVLQSDFDHIFLQKRRPCICKDALAWFHLTSRLSPHLIEPIRSARRAFRRVVRFRRRVPLFQPRRGSLCRSSRDACPCACRHRHCNRIYHFIPENIVCQLFFSAKIFIFHPFRPLGIYCHGTSDKENEDVWNGMQLLQLRQTHGL